MVNGEVAQRDELSKPGGRIHPIESKSRGGERRGTFFMDADYPDAPFNGSRANQDRTPVTDRGGGGRFQGLEKNGIFRPPGRM